VSGTRCQDGGWDTDPDPPQGGAIFLEPVSWFLAPDGAAVCASLLPSVGLRAKPGWSHAGGFDRGLVAQLVRARA
jgi:hypothetical protein